MYLSDHSGQRTGKTGGLMNDLTCNASAEMAPDFRDPWPTYRRPAAHAYRYSASRHVAEWDNPLQRLNSAPDISWRQRQACKPPARTREFPGICLNVRVEHRLKNPLPQYALLH
jgi:hypothetical protein